MAVESEEKKELVHDPVPGYRTAFYIILVVAVIYLSWIFIK